MGKIIDIAAGRLDFSIDKGEHLFNTMMTFASRQNPKRGYLHVNRILGKHIPGAPMNIIHLQHTLATKFTHRAAHFSDNIPVLVVGMSETATGLASGIARHIAATTPREVYQQNTTRVIQSGDYVAINESHSHKTGHRLYINDILSGLQCHLILVDDEISTGRTLTQLAAAIQAIGLKPQSITFSTLAAWVETKNLQDQLKKTWIGRLPDTSLDSMVSGRFSFAPNPEFQPELPETDETTLGGDPLDDTFSSTLQSFHLHDPALETAESIASRLFCTVAKNNAISVVGVGEFMDMPLLVANLLSKFNPNVLFHSTTQSPVLQGGPIKNRFSYLVNGQTEYYYNHDPSKTTILCLPGAESLILRQPLLDAIAAEQLSNNPTIAIAGQFHAD